VPASDPKDPTVPAGNDAAGAETLPGPPERWQARVGDVLENRYELISVIGRGAFAQVFRARDRVADVVVAVKVLASDPNRSQDTIRRFRRELQAAWKVTHPGVVRIYDLIELEGPLAFSMELVDGETLADHLRREPLSADEISRLARDLARALAAAHEAGVTHRDLKPANIILRRGNGRAVITDFGVSRLREAAAEPPPPGTRPRSADTHLTREGDVIGTPLYMAPEQLLGRGDVGPAADVYAFGLVMFEAATGKRPHEGTPADLLDARLHKPPPPLSELRPELPPGLCAIIDRCLLPDVGARFASAVALADEIDLLTAPRGTAAPPSTLRTRRRPQKWLLPALGFVLVTFGLWWWQASTLPDHDRVVGFLADNAGDADDAWIGRALVRMAARKLRDRELRVRVVDDVDAANVIVRLRYRHSGRSIAMDEDVRPSGGRYLRIGSEQSASVAGALDPLLDLLVERACVDQRPRDADAGEQAIMKRLGAPSFAAWRLYARALDATFGSVAFDETATEATVQELLRMAPGWAHAHALQYVLQGEGSERAAQTLATGRAAAIAKDDPSGAHLLEAMALAAQGSHAGAIALIDADFDHNPDDVVLGWVLADSLRAERRVHEAIAVYQRLHSLRPDLQFGSNVAGELRSVGRGAEVPALQRAWLERAPENEQALAAQVSVDLQDGAMKDAVSHARQLLFLHGEAPYRLGTLSDALIVAGQPEEASRIADGMLRGSPIERATGWRRLGQIAILQGRFETAQEALANAISGSAEFGVQGEYHHAIPDAVAVAAMLGHTADVDRLRREWIRFEKQVGNPWRAQVLEFERTLAQHKCPSVDTALAAIPDASQRELAQRHLLRAAAEAGCLRCEKVVAAGFASWEADVDSLYRFASCAEKAGELALARDGFERAQRLRTGTIDSAIRPSTVHAILARARLAHVLERLGEPARARAEYEDFLAHWGHADRPLPEVDDARHALERLTR
jgi:serine/threonine-protein kinase